MSPDPFLQVGSGHKTQATESDCSPSELYHLLPRQHLSSFIVHVQWNLRKWTPPITETSTMQTRVRGPELFPVL